LWTSTKAATDCATAAPYTPDPNVITDYAYNECLDNNCHAANIAWGTTLYFDSVDLSIIACHRYCSPMATAGNAKKHSACISAGLTAAGVKDTGLM